MSSEAYAAEKDGEPLRESTQEKINSPDLSQFHCLRSEGQKIISKIRRILSAMELELEELPMKEISTNETLDEWAKNVTDEISAFIK